MTISSCASRPKDIKASYVSPVPYESMSCEQLRAEAQRLTQSATAANKVQENKAGADAAAVTVGMVLFWPALFMTRGDDASAAEVARLKGEMNALESVSNTKNCGIKVIREEPKA